MSDFIDITEKNKDDYNAVVDHPLQSYEWGKFRIKTGLKVIRRGLVKDGKIVNGFTFTIHKVPYTNFNIGYLPKSKLPNKELLDELFLLGKQQNCIYIQLEPNVEKISNFQFPTSNYSIRPSFHPLFTKYTFILNIDKTEEELLKHMHPKTRYNIRVAQRHNVKVEENSSNEAFEEYLKLTYETTSRQKFYAHTEEYHRKMWETLKVQSAKFKVQSYNELNAHLFTASYKPENTNKPVTLVTWILFTFHNTLYYPYGASSSQYREAMASNLIMWEAIRFGKKLGLKTFDMWGALAPNADKNDPWYGFHRFKEGYGGSLTEFVGSYDLVINPLVYQAIKFSDKFRWLFLRMKKMG